MIAEVEKHYSVAEIAELLSVSERTVWSYVDQGKRSGGREGIHPTVKVSHKVVRIPARAVNEFLRTRTISAASPARELSR